MKHIKYPTGKTLTYRGNDYEQCEVLPSWPATQQLVYRSRRYRPAALMLNGLLSREESKGLRRNQAQ